MKNAFKVAKVMLSFIIKIKITELNCFVCNGHKVYKVLSDTKICFLLSYLLEGWMFKFLEIARYNVISNCFFKQKSFLGTDSSFWNWLGLTRNGKKKSHLKSCFYFDCEALITQTLPTRPHPTTISLPPSSPYPLPQSSIPD